MESLTNKSCIPLTKPWFLQRGQRDSFREAVVSTLRLALKNLLLNIFLHMISGLDRLVDDTLSLQSATQLRIEGQILTYILLCYRTKDH